MIDQRIIIADPALVQANADVRGYEVDAEGLRDDLLTLRSLQADIEAGNRQKKDLSKQQGSRGAQRELEAAGESATASVESTQDAGRSLRSTLSELAAQRDALKTQVDERLLRVPNFLDSRVPIGGEESNIVIRTIGKPREFDFKPKTHQELGVALGVVDFEGAVASSGRQFYALRGAGVKMRDGLVQLFSSLAEPTGFERVSTPVLVTPDTLVMSGYRPFNGKDEFRVSGIARELSLIGTAEQALLGMYAGQVLEEGTLPLRLLGESMCFRTESGRHGPDTAGMIRVHQFFKLEMLVYVDPEMAETAHQDALKLEEQLLEALELPAQTVLTASGDLAAPGKIKYDTEVYFPSSESYREVTSNTNLGDFQTRRANVKVRRDDGSKYFPHTISATAVCDRVIAALLENGQQEDGSVVLPERLADAMRLEDPILRPKTRNTTSRSK